MPALAMRSGRIAVCLARCRSGQAKPQPCRLAGRVYDAEGVGRIASEHGVPFLLDACQSAGQMPLDVAALRCDWLTGTARKYLRGPRGIGFLYASTCAVLTPPDWPASAQHISVLYHTILCAYWSASGGRHSDQPVSNLHSARPMAGCVLQHVCCASALFVHTQCCNWCSAQGGDEAV